MLRLRPARPEDIEHITRWVDSLPAMVQWAGPQVFRYPVTREQFIAYLETAGGPAATSEIVAGIDTTTGLTVAHGELGMINREQETASLCRILIDPSARGQGFGRMLVRALLERGYKDWHLRRIDLRVYAHNLPAIRCYEAEGFVREGVLRQGTRVADMLWDVVLMAHFRDAWVTTNAQRGEIR